MFFLFFHQTTETVIKAVCWTLIHSLWQGLAAAVIAGSIILFTKKATASFRYNLLAMTLLWFLVTSVATFYLQLSNVSDAKESKTAVAETYPIPLLVQEKSIDAAQFGNEQQENFVHRFTGYFNEHAPFIVLIWFVFFLAKSIQLFAGLHYIHRIRYRRNQPVPHEWKERLNQLSIQTGIRDSVLFLQSELVKVPVVIGLIKPVILVPIGLFAQLSVEQVEAILVHELAHIKRKDFLVNLLQSFAEAIYFFNPAIIWISSLIREEREACCDDQVVAFMPHKKTYLEALVSFQSQTFTNPAPAMALGGNKNYLLHRVQRMLTEENKKLNFMEKTVLLLGVIGITAFSFIPGDDKGMSAPVKEIRQSTPFVQKTEFTPTIKKDDPVKKPQSAPVSIVRIDTVPKSKFKSKEVNEDLSFPNLSSSTNDDGKTRTTTIDATDNTGKRYNVKKLNDDITELSVDGVIVPKERYQEYNTSLERINEILMRRNLRSARIGFDDEAKRRVELKEKMRDRELERAAMGEKREWEMKERTLEAKLRNEKRQVELQQKMELNRKLRSEKFRMGDSLRAFKKLNGYRLMDDKMKSRGEIPGIIGELKSNNLIEDADNLSFTLNNKELIVNGKKQSKELHQQFKEKYLNKPGDYFIYKKNGNSTSTSINKE